MRFKLSTTLLVIALISVSLAWFVDSQRNKDITGVWHYPTPRNGIIGYWETLTIRPDGTFEKCERHRGFEEVFNGKYSVNGEGLVTFHVMQKKASSASAGKKYDTFAIDKSYRCRCALDSRNYLIVKVEFPDDLFESNDNRKDDRVGIIKPEDCILHWHCYARATEIERQHMRNLNKAMDLFQRK